MSFSTLSINQAGVVNNLAKYVTGVTINKTGEASAILPGVALMGGIQGGIWAWQNRKDYKGGFQKLKQNAALRDNFINSTNKYNSGKKFDKIKNKWAGAVEYTAKEELEATIQKLKNKYPNPEMQKILNTYTQKLGAQGVSYKALLNDLEKLEASTKLENYTAKVTSQRASGSFFRGLKDKTGITKLSTASKELAVSSKGFRTLMKGIKGNAGFAAFSLGVGVLTDVIPSFQLGTGKGFKQLGKTAVKTGFEVAGWAAGSAVGAKAGAAIGTMVGGPVGTVIGGAVGLVGGFLGSLLFSNVADKITGPSEVEKAQLEMAQQIKQNAMQNFNQLDTLAQEAYFKLLEHAASGSLSEDDLTAKKSLEQLLGSEINIDEEVKQYKQLLKMQSDQNTQSQAYSTLNNNTENEPKFRLSA